MKAIFGAPVALAAVLVLAACSTSVKGTGIAVGAGASGFGSAGASSASPSGGSTAGTNGPAGARTTDQLTAVALRVEDLDGSGWSLLPSTADDSDDGDSTCGDVDAIDKANEAEVDFSQSTLGPFLFESLASAADAASATAVFKKAQAVYANCPPTDSDGDTVSVTPMSFPSVGDQSAGYQVTETGSDSSSAPSSSSDFDGPITLSVVLVRDGRLLEAYGYVALTGGSPASFQTMVKSGVKRAQSAR